MALIRRPFKGLSSIHLITAAKVKAQKRPQRIGPFAPPDPAFKGLIRPLRALKSLKALKGLKALTGLMRALKGLMREFEGLIRAFKSLIRALRAS